MRCAAEVGVQVLCQIPAYGEFPVPQELFAERQRQLGTCALHVALLQFVIVTQHFGIKGYILRQPVNAETFYYIIPLALALNHFLKRLERLVYRCIAIIKRAAPVVFILIYSRFTARMTVAVAITERKVCGVVRHGMPLCLYADPHI